MPNPTGRQKAELHALVSQSLKSQGFRLREDHILPPTRLDKHTRRNLHRVSVLHRVEEARQRLAQHEERLLTNIASGIEVEPAQIRPKLIEVQPGSEHELLFRYSTLHWSIPTSSGYGRRLRFLVVDEHNGKLIGLFGLCDPVFSIRARDNWIGWDFKDRTQRLRHVMEAFVLGAVPPYSMLLCGKLVAMLCASDEVRAAFRRKYGAGESLIKKEEADGRLAMVTTTSALGRSSIYNRVRFEGRQLMISVGYTSGWGEFHFANGSYAQIREYAEKYCESTAKNQAWGTGFRNRREVVRRVLSHLGLSHRFLNHGIKRELFLLPLARNTREFLRGEHSRLQWHHQSADSLAAYFSERWLLPRADRRPEFLEFSREMYRLWSNNDCKNGARG